MSINYVATWLDNKGWHRACSPASVLLLKSQNTALFSFFQIGQFKPTSCNQPLKCQLLLRCVMVNSYSRLSSALAMSQFTWRPCLHPQQEETASSKRRGLFFFGSLSHMFDVCVTLSSEVPIQSARNDGEMRTQAVGSRSLLRSIGSSPALLQLPSSPRGYRQTLGTWCKWWPSATAARACVYACVWEVQHSRPMGEETCRFFFLLLVYWRRQIWGRGDDVTCNVA